MKKRLSQILMALAILVTGSASLGCILFVMEEPTSNNLFQD